MTSSPHRFINKRSMVSSGARVEYQCSSVILTISMEPWGMLISDEMIQTADKEEDGHGRLIKVRLECRNILKICGLDQHTYLTDLRLANNRIQKIEGLDALTNLLRLDLSFNNIKVIEGLDALKKLQTLNLSYNHIPSLDNMDTLEHLEVLSLSGNGISKLSNILYLQPFRNLHSLSLAENPICQEETYKVFVVSQLPNLVYLDFWMVDEKMRDLVELNKKKKAEEEAGALEAQKVAELQLHEDAFVENLNGPQLFERMFADDHEAANLANVPGVAELLATYRERMVRICEQIFENGLAEHTLRKKDVDAFFTFFNEACLDFRQKAAQKVMEFEEVWQQELTEMQMVTDAEMLNVKREIVREKINGLETTLFSMGIEFETDLDDVGQQFKRNITEMVDGFIAFVMGKFSECRELEEYFHKEVLETVMATREQNTGLEDLSETMRWLLLSSKDTVLNSIKDSHETHLRVINDYEDELIKRISNWKTVLMQTVEDEQVNRWYIRHKEFYRYFKNKRMQLDQPEQE